VIDNTWVVVLAWPPRACQPNTRVHPHTRTTARRLQRGEAAATALLSPDLPDDIVLQGELLFVPPDRRRRDLDNLIASMKGALDGVFDEQGRDDRELRVITGYLAEPDRADSRVELRIRPATTAQRVALGLAAG
jgi:crossover junction endodeoxyribonuclease RusA